jgi:chromosome segregation ATPase
MEDDMNILSWLTRTEKTSQERAESIFQKMLKAGESAVSVEDAQFAISVIGRDEIQRRHEADVERRRREDRRERIPAELREAEVQAVRLHQAIPDTAGAIEKMRGEIKGLERSVDQQRKDLHSALCKIEELRREAGSLGLPIPENRALPPRPSQAPLPPPIPAPPKADRDAKSTWVPESPCQPAWPTVTRA